VFAQETKDTWDKLSAVSGLAVALIGASATGVFAWRQRKTENHRNSREIAIQRVQTVQTFLPHLASKNELEKRAALLAIRQLDDAELASKLATLFGGEGAVSALATIARSPNQQDANFARRSLGELLDMLRLSVVLVRVRVDPDQTTTFEASGFVVRSDGLIVTVHLIMLNVEPNSEFSVQFPNEASPRKAQIVQTFPKLGIALLQVEGESFHALPIEEKLPTVGEEIFALHHPRGEGVPEEAWTPVLGEVLGTSLEPDEPNMQETLFIKATLEGWGESGRGGFAGMPTVNSGGQVVGMGHSSASSGGTAPLASLLIPAKNASLAIASISSDSDTRE